MIRHCITCSAKLSPYAAGPICRECKKAATRAAHPHCIKCGGELTKYTRYGSKRLCAACRGAKSEKHWCSQCGAVPSRRPLDGPCKCGEYFEPEVIPMPALIGSCQGMIETTVEVDS